ncbi:MAG: ATP-grasp domain-containing protein [Elusimicrobia bacterium]|nr:ATP-grasp domain-containing protein [Elusimicrobiota bacterium]
MLKKATAALLSAIIVGVAPGFDAYRAVAQNTPRAGDVKGGLGEATGLGNGTMSVPSLSFSLSNNQSLGLDLNGSGLAGATLTYEKDRGGMLASASGLRLNASVPGQVTGTLGGVATSANPAVMNALPQGNAMAAKQDGRQGSTDAAGRGAQPHSLKGDAKPAEEGGTFIGRLLSVASRWRGDAGRGSDSGIRKAYENAAPGVAETGVATTQSENAVHGPGLAPAAQTAEPARAAEIVRASVPSGGNGAPGGSRRSKTRTLLGDFYEIFGTPLVDAARTGVNAAKALVWPFLHPLQSARALGGFVLHPVASTRHGIDGLKKTLTGGAGLADLDASQKAFLLAQVLFLVGVTIYLTSIPVLAAALTGNAAFMGNIRATHYIVFGVTSLISGRIARSISMKNNLVAGAVGRIFVLTSMAALALSTLSVSITWPLILALVALNSIIVAINHLVDIDTDGARLVFRDDKKIEKSIYLFEMIDMALMLAFPPLLGLGIDALGPLLGSTLGLLTFAAMMGVSGWLYKNKVHIVGDAPQKFKLETTKGLPGAIGWTALAASAGAMAWGGFLYTTGAAGAIATLGLGGVLLVAGGVLLLHWDTLGAIFGNGTVRNRWFSATAEKILEDALPNVIYPALALQVLVAGAFGVGLLQASVALAGLIVMNRLLSYAQKFQEEKGLKRFLSVLTLGASLAVIPSMGLWLAPSMATAIGVAFLIQYLSKPIQSRMRSMLQIAIKDDPRAREKAKDIWSLMEIVQGVVKGLGALGFGWLLLNSGVGTVAFALLGDMAALKAVSITFGAMIFVYVYSLRQIMKPRRMTFYADPDQAKAKEIEAKGWEKLQKTLKLFGHDRLPVKKIAAADPNRPTVVVMAHGSHHKFSILREGGRQAPGDVFLAIDPSWLEQEIDPATGVATNYLKKGVTFDERGKPVLVEHATPRRIHYFGDWFTPGANDRSDGLPLEKNIKIPTSSSRQLEMWIGDKARQTLILAAKGIAIPATLMFIIAGNPLAKDAKDFPKATVYAGSMPEENARQRDEIRGRLNQFIAKLAKDKEEIVIKPSGSQFHSGRGVGFFKRGQVEQMIDHVVMLSKDEMILQGDGAVLINERIEDPAVYIQDKDDGSGLFNLLWNKKNPIHLMTRKEIPSALPHEIKDWNFRVQVHRTPWGGAETASILARAGTRGKPTNAEPEGNPLDAAGALRWEDIVAALRLQHGLLKTDAEAAAFMAEVKALGKNALEAVIEAEKSRVREPGEPAQSQTDYIGLDVMVDFVDGKLVPKIIEINDHDSGLQPHYDWLNPGQEGLSSRGWIANMLARAAREAMRGKRLVIVGSGYESKRFFFEKAKELGIKIVLIAPPDSWAKDLVEEFIPVDSTNHKTAVPAAVAALREIQKRGKLDGITTFWEDDVVLKAKVAEGIGLPSYSVEMSEDSRDKFRMRRRLENAGMEMPSRFRVSDDKDLEAAIRKLEGRGGRLKRPMVVKPAEGAESQGNLRVNTVEELRKGVARTRAYVAASDDPIFAQSRDVFIEDYLGGREWDANIAVQNGKLIWGAVTDNWPTREPYFTPTGFSSPTRRLSATERQAALDYALEVVLKAGFTDGVFHVEGKTDKTPMLLENNIRPGGHYVVPTDEAVTGVSQAELLYAIALGVQIHPYSSPTPLVYKEGEFVFPDTAGVFLGIDGVEEAKKITGIDIEVLVKPGTPVETYNRVVMIDATVGAAGDMSTIELAKSKLRIRIGPKS